MARLFQLAIPALVAILLGGCGSTDAPPAPDPTTLEAVALTPGLYALHIPGARGSGSGSSKLPSETCIGPQAATIWVEKILGEDYEQKSDCSNTNSDTAGRRVTGKLICPQPGIVGTTEYAYAGANDADSFVVTAQMSIVPDASNTAGKTYTYPISIEGKRKGDCR